MPSRLVAILADIIYALFMGAMLAIAGLLVAGGAWMLWRLSA